MNQVWKQDFDVIAPPLEEKSPEEGRSSIDPIRVAFWGSFFLAVVLFWVSFSFVLL